jgi:hypothetical protein
VPPDAVEAMGAAAEARAGDEDGNGLDSPAWDAAGPDGLVEPTDGATATEARLAICFAR